MRFVCSEEWTYTNRRVPYQKETCLRLSAFLLLTTMLPVAVLAQRVNIDFDKNAAACR